MAVHCQSASSLNPLHRIYQKCSSFPGILSPSLIRRCWDNKLLMEYTRSQLGLTEDEQVSLSTFLKKWTLERVKSHAMVLASYISPQARLSNGYGPDSAIKATPNSLSRLALRWRTNTLCHLKICRCGQQMTRSHALTCFTDIPSFQIQNRRWNPPGSNAIDHALNLQDFTTASQQMDMITTQTR